MKCLTNIAFIKYPGVRDFKSNRMKFEVDPCDLFIHMYLQFIINHQMTRVYLYHLNNIINNLYANPHVYDLDQSNV